jgi:adenylate cyclase class 2
VNVDGAAAVTDLLARLGYVRQLAFEKRRESWKIDKATIELDNLPHLGSYVEIEAATEAEVIKLRDKLGLSDLTPVTASYPDLVAHFLSERGNHENTLTFE